MQPQETKKMEGLEVWSGNVLVGSCMIFIYMVGKNPIK